MGFFVWVSLGFVFGILFLLLFAWFGFRDLAFVLGFGGVGVSIDLLCWAVQVAT